jgi:hypothetical protein
LQGIFLFKYLRIYDREGLFNGPVDPVEDVEAPVGAQREEVVAGDGLRLSGLAHHEQLEIICIVSVSLADPNPDPPDPHVFGNPGSGSISQSYGSGYGFFYH